MIDTPHIVQTERQLLAVVRHTIPRSEITQVMGPSIGEVIGAVTAQGIGPAGQVLSHHFTVSPEIFDFEVGVPVRSPVNEVGRVKSAELPAARVARTVYHGPYEGLGAAWGQLRDWVASQGEGTAAGLWECYLTGPESSADASHWRTELNQPLA